MEVSQFIFLSEIFENHPITRPHILKKNPSLLLLAPLAREQPYVSKGYKKKNAEMEKSNDFY